MTQPRATLVIPAMLGLAGVACEALMGDVDVTKAQPPREQEMGSLQGTSPPSPAIDFPPIQLGLPPAPNPGPVGGTTSPLDAGMDAGTADAGGTTAPADAAPPPLPVLVDAPTQQALVGIVGGGPRLGTCQGGVVVGVRPTANPSTDAFGQRLTFIEPLCASAAVIPPGDPSSPRIALQRDDALVNWSAVDPFLGVPSTEVPDSRLTWLPQPPALCPEAAPALVGLSGEYDPVAPDDTETDAFRSLVIECAPLLLADNGIDVVSAESGHLLISQADSFSAAGSATYRSACADGTAVTQIQLHSGFWLDGFVLGCSTLRAGR